MLIFILFVALLAAEIELMIIVRQHKRLKAAEGKLARLSATDDELMCILEATESPLAQKLLEVAKAQTVPELRLKDGRPDQENMQVQSVAHPLKELIEAHEQARIAISGAPTQKIDLQGGSTSGFVRLGNIGSIGSLTISSVNQSGGITAAVVNNHFGPSQFHDFTGLLEELRSENFDGGRLGVLRDWLARGMNLHPDQRALVMKSFAFDGGRDKARKLLRGEEIDDDDGAE